MLSDLESSFDAERRADLVAQSAELAEAEHASIEVVDRLRGTVGRPIHLRTRSGAPVDGVLTRVEPAYVLVDEGEGLQAIVPLAAVTMVATLAGPAPRDDRRRPTLGALLREVARRGVRVRLIAGAGEVVGRLIRVGADHVDIALDSEGRGCARRATGAGVVGVVSVMTAAIEVLRSRCCDVEVCARGTCRGLVKREGVDGRAAQTSSSSPQPAATMARVEASWR